MKIQNKLLEDSFDYRNNTNNCDLSECIISLDGVYIYISSIDERLLFDWDCISSQEIETGVPLSDWLWSGSQVGKENLYRIMLAEILSKPMAKQEACEGYIEVCLYPREGCASTKKEYTDQRRDILSTIADKVEFCCFMRSCFIDSVFSRNIDAGFNTIQRFSVHASEIVKNLSVLNDEAYELYVKHKSNLKTAYDILTAKLLECSPDPDNVKHLVFDFVDDNDGVESVECSPHTKLIRKDSDLRIYFYWRHERIGGRSKVLIGWIGSHPY